MNIVRLKCLLFACLIASALPAWAASTLNPAQLSFSTFMGADGHQRLVQEAKKEGSVVFYTSIAGSIIQKLRVDFEKRYGVKVVLWRANDRAVVQRIMAENQAGLPGADLAHVGILEMEMLHREKTLQPITSPYEKDLMEGSLSPHKEWISTFVNIIVQAYNTDKVKKEELPKTYQDLLDPKWKGRLGLVGTDEEWFYGIVQSMGEEKGLKFFRDLVATNHVAVRDGHSLLNNLVVAGEVPLGITAFGHMALASKKKGAPIDYVALDPTFAVAYGMGVTAKPPHPHAALLFYKYLLTDGQDVLAQLGYVPNRVDIETPFKNIKYQRVNIPHFLDEFNKWTDLWEDIVVRKKAVN